jgi:hypothetical protein
MADVNAISHAASDVSRFLKSKTLSTFDNDGNRVTVFIIQRKTFVADVFAQVQVGYTAASTGTVLVGIKTPDIDVVDFFMAEAAVASEVLGMKPAPLASKAYYFEKGGSITVSLAKGDSAADVKVRIFADTKAIY